MNMDVKILITILENGIQEYIKKIMHVNQIIFIPEKQVCFNTQKSIEYNGI